MMEDKYLETLQKRVEDMDSRDKAGMSFIDVYRPYSDMYNYVMMKIGLLCEADRKEAEKLLYGK